MGTNFINEKLIVWSFLFFICLSTPAFSMAQNNDVQPGSLAFLNDANGYGDLILGADTKDMTGKKFTFLDDNNTVDADSCFKFKYADTTMLHFQDDLQLDLVGLRTHKNRIANIYLFFKIEDGFKMLKALQNFFGQPTSHPGDFKYDWATEEVTLQLRFDGNNDLGIAIFSSTKILKDISTGRETRANVQANVFSNSDQSTSIQNDIVKVSKDAALSATVTNP